jgi:general secretion pathway protein E
MKPRRYTPGMERETLMASLRLKPTREYGRPIALAAEPVTIGRHPDNTICIKDEKASRFHCVIEPDGNGGWRVRDLESRNGTKVNGSRMDQAPLAAGDLVKVGDHEFAVEPVEGAAPAAGVDEAQEGEKDRKEREREKRKAARAEAKEGPPPPWAVELQNLIDALPPKMSAAETIALVDAGGRPSDALQGNGDGPRIVRLMLLAASKAHATDIHLEPKGEKAQIRMRVDGQMVWIVEAPARIGEVAGGLIKAVCQMKAAAKDAVQEGHFSARFPDRRVDFRVSFIPSVHGQKLVMRLLDQRDIPHSISELGLASYMCERVKQVCEKDSGLLLVCGPTGSGKTTTLYNALREIDRETHNVVTIEDPVEYQLENVTQMPIDEIRGNTFGSLLRSVLRQDPDVIFVGEIRDDETARTAMQAAMTGHLVFSTVHAKDTISAVFRLLDLKVEPYLVANSLDLLLAQRLVRVLCENCKSAVPVAPAQVTRMGRFLMGKTQVYTATGCTKCLRTGYRGRRAIFELLDFNDELRDVVLKEPSITAMKKVIEQGLFTTLVQFGWRLVAEGVTSLEEVDAVAGMG